MNTEFVNREFDIVIDVAEEICENTVSLAEDYREKAIELDVAAARLRKMIERHRYLGGTYSGHMRYDASSQIVPEGLKEEADKKLDCNPLAFTNMSAIESMRCSLIDKMYFNQPWYIRFFCSDIVRYEKAIQKANGFVDMIKANYIFLGEEYNRSQDTGK